LGFLDVSGGVWVMFTFCLSRAGSLVLYDLLIIENKRIMSSNMPSKEEPIIDTELAYTEIAFTKIGGEADDLEAELNDLLSTLSGKKAKLIRDKVNELIEKRKRWVILKYKIENWG